MTPAAARPAATTEVDRLIVAVRTAGNRLDALGPLRDARLWAARCALDTAVLMLLTYRQADEDTELAAVAAARASVVAATDAVVTSRERRS